MTAHKTYCIRHLTLADSLVHNAVNVMRNEQQAAMDNLKRRSYYHPHNDRNGPYDVNMGMQENRLVLDINNAANNNLPSLILSLTPYKRLIKDYFMMIESHEQARRHAGREKLEAIDMGRRGVHNEGAELFMSRLEDKITMDHDTARGFFTLICALQTEHKPLL